MSQEEKNIPVEQQRRDGFLWFHVCEGKERGGQRG